MFKTLWILFLFLTMSAANAQTSSFLAQYQSTTPGVNIPVSTTNPLPVTVGTASIIGVLPVANGGNIYNAAEYGALCNGINLTDVTTTASSASVSSATYTFTTADIGKYITLGAGGTNTTTGTFSAASPNIASLGSPTGIAVGDYVYGANIPAGARVTSKSTAISTVSIFPSVPTGTGTAQSLTFAHVINTTITGVSSGSATLAVTPSYSIAGTGTATFGTSDSTSIAATVAAASSAGGGTVKFPNGICIVTSSIAVPTKISFEGGEKSIIKWLSTSDQTTAVFQGNEAYDATSCNAKTAEINNADNHFYNFEIDEDAATMGVETAGVKGIALACSARSWVDHLYVHGTPKTAIATDSGFPTTVTNNYIVNAGRLSVQAYGANGIGEGLVAAGGDTYVINNNTIINPKHFGIFVESESSNTSDSNFVATGNVIVGGPASGTNGDNAAGIGNSGARSAVITGNRISSANLFSNAVFKGVTTDTGTLSSNAGAGTVVTGNSIQGGTNGITINYAVNVPGASLHAKAIVSGNSVRLSSGTGIQLQASTSGSALDNITISGNLIDQNVDAGIAILTASTGSASNISIFDNTISNNGTNTGTDNRKAAIFVKGITVDKLRVGSNAIFDNLSGTQKYGISIDATGTVTNGFVMNNDFTGVPNTVFLNAGSYGGWIANNKNLNPIGASSVSCPSSGATYTAGVYPETDYFAATTVALAKGGVTLTSGLTSASVNLQPNEVVTVTYTGGCTQIKDIH